jgi:hypothetical protein
MCRLHVPPVQFEAPVAEVKSAMWVETRTALSCQATPVVQRRCFLWHSPPLLLTSTAAQRRVVQRWWPWQPHHTHQPLLCQPRQLAGAGREEEWDW